jgi:cholinesterase
LILPYTSEDCLFLNIWTKPETQRKKAVLLWIYGGAFEMGGAMDPLENGASLASSQDIIVVNFGYRLNVFGFPGAPGLKHANPGLLDQRLAVEWARDNIAAFGGDPKNILLGGASSGGMATDSYSFSWKSDPIVSGFVLMSGTAAASTFFKPEAESSLEWREMTRKLRCPEEGDSAIQCVQSKSISEIQSAVEPWIGGPPERTIIPPFRPIADGKTVLSRVKFFKMGESGCFAQLVGFLAVYI